MEENPILHFERTGRFGRSPSMRANGGRAKKITPTDGLY